MAGQVVERHGGEIPARPRRPDRPRAASAARRRTSCSAPPSAIAAGVVVDTHVKRLAFRLGLTKAATPESDRARADAGRPAARLGQPEPPPDPPRPAGLPARRPRCEACSLAEICPKVGVVNAGRPAPIATPAAEAGRLADRARGLPFARRRRVSSSVTDVSMPNGGRMPRGLRALTMHIHDIFKAHPTTFSFEFFPPKTDKASEELFATIAQLQALAALVRLRDLRRRGLDPRADPRPDRPHPARDRASRPSRT